MKPIIRVDNLGKQYQIGARAAGYMTLRESLVGAVRAPLQRLRAGRSVPETVWALRGVGFEVMPGEVVGVIGRNGAGKSTLLKVLSRITEPTEGYAHLYGRVASLLEVGTGFHSELTGRENIFLNGAILGMARREIQRKFDEIVAFAEVDRFIDTPVKRYSSGMYLRLAFAVAAHLEPEILVVDEVLAVGDAEFQKKCLSKMDDVYKAGRTILFVSHNMNAIEQLCSCALLLDKGRIQHFSTDIRHVIKEHLFGNDENELGLSEWINDDKQFENPWFKPLRFFIADKDGNRSRMPASNDGEIWFQAEGVIEQGDPALTVGYAIYAEDGHLLYWSYQSDEAPDQWPKLRPGRCVLRSRIPPRLLNEGLYRIEMIGSLSHRKWLFAPGVDAPSIFLTIQGGLSESPLWMVKRPGILAPVLPWSATDESGKPL